MFEDIPIVRRKKGDNKITRIGEKQNPRAQMQKEQEEQERQNLLNFENKIRDEIRDFEARKKIQQPEKYNSKMESGKAIIHQEKK